MSVPMAIAPARIGPTTEKVIVSITIGNQTLDLRDGATCLPLWRGKRW
ncbi:MAG: hypothetical protein M0Z60_13140 [Nitrospiraceae bacterium]|nr:hypothetical protein [Nitrospiraceae bacterium]